MYTDVLPHSPDAASADSVDSSGRSTPRLTYPAIATPRLRLRAFELADIPQLVAIAGEHHVADTAIDLPQPFTAQFAQRWIASHATDWDTHHALHWAISVLDDGRLVGYAGLLDINLEDRQTELSVWVGREAQRQVLATQAAQAALAFAFTTLGMNRVCALHLTRNSLLARILANTGMRQEGLLRQRVCKWGQFEDVLVWAILRSEWIASL